VKNTFIYYAIVIAIFAQKKPFTIQDVISKSEFQLKSVYGVQWTPDGNGYVSLKYNRDTKSQDLVYYDIRTGKEEVYIDAKLAVLEGSKREKRFTLPNFYWSPTNTNIILVPRKNDLYLFYKDSKKLVQLTNDDLEERDPRFSPDGKEIAYLKKNNLFILNIEKKTERQVTEQGTEKILIGRFDWVYEEEFGIRTGFFWSPNSKSIAYFELTDAETYRFPIVDYIPIKNTVEYLPYAKAGSDNSTVKIAVVDVETAKSRYMDIESNKDELIPRIKWTENSDELSIYKMNRDQDYLDFYIADVNKGKSKLILKESEPNGWISINDDLTYLENGNFIYLSRNDGYYHIYLYEKSGKLIKQLTSGKWEVTSIHGYDKKTSKIFFTAAKNSDLERELYSVSLENAKLELLSENFGYHNINMSPNYFYYIDYFSTSTEPLRVDIKTSSGKLVRNLVTNQKDIYNEYQFGTKELLKFKTKYGFELNATMIKPYNFDPKKKYPVFVTQYSGPGSQQVNNSFKMGRGDRWLHYLSSKGIIVFTMDPRGTGFRGKEFEQMTNHKLMQLEAEDLVEGAEYLRTLPYVEKNKIGIYGWSYGGQMSSYVIMKYPDAYNLSIAVAPVINYKNYDTIYSERYMSTPEKNNDNYDMGSSDYYAKGLKNPFLLIHGTADDNVHFSNSMQLVHELVKHQKQFETFFYPRSMHGMSYDYKNTAPHLYTLMSDFIFKHF
jgi:dipeptidyl-peptidase 4